MLDFQATRWTMDGEVPQQAGNDHPTGIPTGVFPTADGHINIAASGQVLWERFCRAAGLDDLLDEPDYKSRESRSKNRHQLNARIAAWTERRPSAEWIDLMTEAGGPGGPVYPLARPIAEPPVAHRPGESPDGEEGDT